MPEKKIISVVIPVYNEQENLLVVYETLSRELESLSSRYGYELIFVNDGSADRSWEILRAIAACDEYVSAFCFSKNFGHQAALTAGYDRACGDCIISMDADMQDPPILIHEMIKKWEEGFQIVYARRMDRKDGFLKKMTASLY